MRSRALGLMAVSLAGLLVLVAIPSALSQGDPAPGVADWLEADYDLTISDQLDHLDLTGTISIHEVAPPAGSELERACGSSCSADEIREAYGQADADQQRQLRDGIEEAVEDRTKAALASLSSRTASPTADATVDRSTLDEGGTTGSTYDPAIRVDVVGGAPVEFAAAEDHSQAQIDAIFRMGARVDVVVDPVVDPGTELEITIQVPEGLSVLDTTGGATIGPEALRATFVEDNTASATPTAIDGSMTVGREDVVVPNEEAVELEVIIDLGGVDVNYGNLFGSGPPASADVRIDVRGAFSALKTPTGELPNVRLPYLSADALRIGLENEVIGRDNLTQIEQEARASIREAFSSTFGADVQPEGGFVQESLGLAPGDPVGTGPAVRFDMGAGSTVGFPPEEAASGATAFEITRFEIGGLTLPSVPLPGDHPVRYTILLPPGTNIVFQNVDGGQVVEETEIDGRRAISFQTDPGSDGAEIQGAEIVIEHPFVWHVLWPVLLFIVLVFVVLPAALIIWVIARRRKRGRAEADEQPGQNAWQAADDPPRTQQASGAWQRPEGGQGGGGGSGEIQHPTWERPDD